MRFKIVAFIEAEPGWEMSADGIEERMKTTFGALLRGCTVTTKRFTQEPPKPTDVPSQISKDSNDPAYRLTSKQAAEYLKQIDVPRKGNT